MKLKSLTDLPNIGKTLSKKLSKIGIKNHQELMEVGSEKALPKIDAIENSGSCLNMLYPLDGAIQGVQWHGLDAERKQVLKEFYRMVK